MFVTSTSHSQQHYVIKFVSDLRKVGGFLRVLRFPPPIKHWPPWYNWNIVESGVNHHNQPTYPPIHLPLLKLFFFYLPKLHMCSCISPNGFTSKVICIRWSFPYIAIRKDYKPENNFISLKKENLKDGALHYHWIKNNSLSLNWF